MNEVLSTFRREARTLVWPGGVTDARPHTTWRQVDGGAGVLIMAHDLSEANVDAVIQAEIAECRRLQLPFEWKVFSFDEPADLLERLVAAGLTAGEREAIVVYDVHNGPLEAHASDEVYRVDTLERLEDFRMVAEEVFERDYSMTTSLLAEAIRTGQKGHDAYVAYVNGVPASVGRLYTHPESEFAGFYGGGTRKGYRGHGLYRAVVAARARDAAAFGARYLQVDALPTSLPILLRLGFVHLADTWPCTQDEPTYFT